MYAIHTTPGFIIESRPWGDAGKIISVFTKEFGLISATAQGIRLEKSKLRYHTQDYSLGEFSFVKGKEFWRLTSAQIEAETSRAPYIYLSSRIAALLKRAMPGQEAHPELFDIVRECLGFAYSESELITEHLQTLESATIFMIVRALGYIAPSADITAIAPPTTVADLDRMTPMRISMNRHINTALRESHL